VGSQSSSSPDFGGFRGPETGRRPSSPACSCTCSEFRPSQLASATEHALPLSAEPRPPSNVRSRRLVHFAVFAALAGLFGCATVRPADREILSDPAMTYGSDGPAIVHEAHVLNNREGSFGAGEASGGGCGCN